jgi:hypothetical protein
VDEWTWDTVNWSGAGGIDPEFDPKIWILSAGEHTFTFYGREARTKLDQVALRRCAPTGPCDRPEDMGCSIL